MSSLNSVLTIGRRNQLSSSGRDSYFEQRIMMIASQDALNTALAEKGRTDYKLTGDFAGSNFKVTTPGSTISGKKPDGTRYKITSNDPKTPIFDVKADNVKIDSVHLDGGEKKDNPEDQEFSNQGVRFSNTEGTTVSNSRLDNFGRGAFAVGTIKDLTFKNNEGSNLDAVVAVNRDVGRDGGKDAFDWGTVDIQNNRFDNTGFAQYSLDAGNDGTDGDPRLLAAARKGELAPGEREKATTTPTKVRGQISNNNGTGRGFGVAIANIDGQQPTEGVSDKGLNIDTNTFDISGDRAFGEALHFEHGSRNISAASNTFTASGSGIKNVVGIGTFTDKYRDADGNPQRDNSESFTNGTENIRLANNSGTVSGEKGSALNVGGTRDLRLEGDRQKFERQNEDGSRETSAFDKVIPKDFRNPEEGTFKSSIKRNDNGVEFDTTPDKADRPVIDSEGGDTASGDMAARPPLTATPLSAPAPSESAASTPAPSADSGPTAPAPSESAASTPAPSSADVNDEAPLAV